MISRGLCSAQILLLPERKVSAVRRRAHDEAMSYVLANNLSGTKRRKKRKRAFVLTCGRQQQSVIVARVDCAEWNPLFAHVKVLLRTLPFFMQAMCWIE